MTTNRRPEWYVEKFRWNPIAEIYEPDCTGYYSEAEARKYFLAITLTNDLAGASLIDATDGWEIVDTRAYTDADADTDTNTDTDTESDDNKEDNTMQTNNTAAPRYYSIYLPGDNAMRAALEYIGPRCYRPITDPTGRYMGQIENVVDAPGHELTVIVYINSTDDVHAILDELAANGFSGLTYSVCSYSDAECLYNEQTEGEGTITAPSPNTDTTDPHTDAHTELDNNDRIITITMRRIDICNLMLACTSAAHRAGTGETAHKWRVLHDELKEALEAFDREQAYYKPAHTDPATDTDTTDPHTESDDNNEEDNTMQTYKIIFTDPAAYGIYCHVVTAADINAIMQEYSGRRYGRMSIYPILDADAADLREIGTPCYTIDADGIHATIYRAVTRYYIAQIKTLRTITEAYSLIDIMSKDAALRDADYISLRRLALKKACWQD